MRFTKVAVAVAAVVLLAGCSGGDGDDSEDTSSNAAKSPEELYLDTVRKGADVSQVSDSALLTAGHAVCTALGNGAEPLDVLAGATETAGDSGIVILGTAVSTLCREHLDAAQELAEQLN